MARIPLGDFGNVVARPGPVVHGDPGAYGAGVGQALTQAGQIGMHTAARDQAIAEGEAKQEQRERDAAARQAAREATAEAAAAQRQAAAEAKAAAREAARVKALTAQAAVSNGLADLHDEIEQGLATGAIDKTKAGELYASRSAKLLEEGLKGVDPEHQELARATVLGTVNRGRAGVAKLVTAKDRADILAGGLSYFEEMQRFAARGPLQADQAIENVRKFWTATGPQAGEDAAQAARRVQQFAERVRLQQATALVNADPKAAMTALKDPGYLPELDPQQRTALVQAADVRLTQAANRAEIRAQARERVLERTWNAVSTVLDAGKQLEPAYAADALRTFKGTVYEPVLRAAMEQAPQQAAFASQPIAAQRAALDAQQARMNTGGATPGDIAAYKRMETAHKAALQDLKADPYAAANERGVLPQITPLSLDLATLPQQLQRRTQEAAVVSAWAGQDVSLFRPAEIDKLAPIIQALPPKDRAVTMQGLARTMTPGQMREFARQLGAKDDTLAAAAILSAQGAKSNTGRLAAEYVLAGADAMKDNRVKWPAGQDMTAVRADIDTLTRGAFLSEAAQRAAGDAALAAYAGLLAEGKAPDAGQAVRLVTGGIMEMGGARIVKPYGWTDDRVRAALRSFDAPALAALTGGNARLGDKVLADAELARLMPGAQLGPSPQPGAYTVSIGGRMVTGKDGRPLLVPIGDR